MTIDIQWPLVVFSLLAGVAGALAAFVAVAELSGKAKEPRFHAAILALVFMVVGGVASMLHLASPQNAMAAATNLGSFSGISVELIMLGLAFALVAVYAVMVKKNAAPGAAKVIAALMLVAGLVLAFVCGHGYVIDARQYWDTNLLPLSYLGSVLPVGGFLYVALALRAKAAVEELRLFQWLAAGSVAISALTMAAYLLYVGPDVLRLSPVWAYGGVVGCGIVATALCAGLLLAQKERCKMVLWAWIGVAASTVGALALRALMWAVSVGFLDLFASATNLMFGGM